MERKIKYLFKTVMVGGDISFRSYLEHRCHIVQFERVNAVYQIRSNFLRNGLLQFHMIQTVFKNFAFSFQKTKTVDDKPCYPDITPILSYSVKCLVTYLQPKIKLFSNFFIWKITLPVNFFYLDPIRR